MSRGAGLIACAAALAVRLPRLGADSLWYDETVSAYLASRSAVAALRHTSLDIHPPGYYLLLGAWTRLAGSSEYALAFLSLAAGVLLVALTYALAARLAGRRYAAPAAWLAALSAYSIWYSQEVRMYTLGACLVTALLLITRRLLQAGARRREAVLWGALAAAALYVFYYAALIVAFTSALWLAVAARRRALPAWATGQATLFLLYLPWLPTAVRQAIDPPVPPWRSPQPLVEMLRQGATALVAGEALPAWAWPAAALLIAAALAAGYCATRGRSATLLLGAFIVPWLALALASIAVPLFHPRYLLPFAPAFWVALATAWGGRPRPRRAAGLAAIAAFVALNGIAQWRAWTHPDYTRDDLRAAVRTLEREWCPGDVVLVNAGYTYTAFAHYWQGRVQWLGRLSHYDGQEAVEGPMVLLTGSLAGSPSLGWRQADADFYATSLDETTAALSRAVAANHRLWVLRLYDTVTDPEGDLRQWLDDAYLLAEDHLIPGPSFARLQAYVPRLERLPCEAPAWWEGAVSTCARVPAAAGGGRLPVTVAVRYGDRVPPGTLHYTLRLVDATDATLVQRDGLLGAETLTGQAPPPGLTIEQPLALRLPAGAAPGEYRVLLGLYNLSDGALRNLTPSPAGADGLVEVGRVVVAAAPGG